MTMDQGGSYRKFVNEDTVTETEMSLIGLAQCRALQAIDLPYRFDES